MKRLFVDSTVVMSRFMKRLYKLRRGYQAEVDLFFSLRMSRFMKRLYSIQQNKQQYYNILLHVYILSIAHVDTLSLI